MAPQSRFTFDNPAGLPFLADWGFELLSALFYLGMLVLLVSRLEIKSVPFRLVAAAAGAWVGVAAFCIIGLVSTLGFADGSETRVFAASTAVSAILIVIAVAFAAIGTAPNKLKHKHD